MKLASYTTLSAAAAVLLQLGTFVHANPMFEEHNDAASTDDANCQGFRVTFPAGTGLQFEENSKHLVAWGKAPAGLDQVNVTLANANQEAVAWLGLYDASLGATTSEMPFPLNGQQPGDYHIHLAGVGSTACQVDSDPFKMNAAKSIQQATTNNLQQTGSNTSSDDHQDDASSNFTNDDQRTHLNEDMLNEIEQLAQEKTKHDNAKYFTNDDQRTNKQHSNADASWFTNDDQRSHKNDGEHDDSLDAWSTEEVSMEDAKTWHDDSADVVDHSNVGEWTSEDLDRAHVDAEGFYNEEEHVDDATVNYITDYSNVGEWQAEQVDANEDEYVASHDDASPADGWVEDGKSDLFDHTNLGSFSAEEITVDDDAVQQHQDITGWQAEEIQVLAEEQQQHDNVADNWVDESGSEQEQHEDDATAWITEELDENGLSNDLQQQHKNDAEEEEEAPAEWHMDELPTSVPSWEEQVDNASLADHTDAAPFIAEEIKEDNEHANIADQWMDESSSTSTTQPHANVADQWMDESASTSTTQPHANVADQWVENEAAPHADQAAAPTSGKGTTGILPNYSSDSSALNDDDTTSSSSSNTHNDAAPISWLSPEALMAKW